ncbi:hypothetical protein Leryth_019807 [Lithospermum erythrorhizon]|nr:hypothetical protein Leryth_019807 [Lithospermum erythrorhizon]
MDYMESPESHISKSLNFLKRQKIMHLSGVNGGILNEHIMSLKRGFKFLATLLEFSQNQDLKQRIKYSVANMKHKLYLLTFDRKDGGLFINLEQAYVVLRREMKNIIIKSGTNEYDVIFPDNFTLGNHYFKVSSFLCQEIKKLVTSDYKADQITPMISKLEDIREMLTYFLEPMFENATDANWPLVVTEEGTQIFTLITDLLDRATCLIYMCFVGKMDDEMVFSLKSSLSDLVIQETQIMKVYLVLDIYYTRSFTYHISLSLRLLEWNKKCCSVSNLGGALEDHFMSIKHGLQFLDRIFKHSGNRDLQLNIEHLVTIVKQKLHSLLNNQKDEHWTVDLDHAYSDLREEMKNVVIVPGTDTNESLFTWVGFKGEIIDFILEKIMVLASSKCKVNQIIPLMELEELRKMLTSLKYVRYSTDGKDRRFLKCTHIISFIGEAARLIYLTFIGKLNEEMLLSIREDLSYLIERTDVEEMFHKGETLRHCKDNFESNIDISLSLLKIQGTYHMGTINETMLKDHIMSLEYGLKFLKWRCELSKNEDLEYGHKFHPSVMSRFTNLEQRIMLFAGNVKLKLESVAYKHEDETLNMDVNHAYADLREEMKNIIIMPGTNEYDTLIPVNLTWGYNFGGINDFLLEKTMTLVTSNCKSGEVAPLMKELEDLQKMLTSLRPLCLYIGKHWNKPEKILLNFLTFYDNATCLIYLSFVGKMDIEMVLSVKIMKETDVWELYTTILNVVRSHYPERELYLLENLISLLELNIESLNDANSKLYEVLIDIRTFLLGLYPNMLFRKLHLLEPSFQAILGHSIPIVCSCYLEHTEVDISAALKCVLDQIKLIKSEVLKIKLYYFPRTDDLGFLEFFLGYLDDLMKNHEISMKEEIDALLSELHSLISLVTHKEINEDRWTGIINMAYEAEYIIDLHLVSSSSDLGLITSLSKIIQQLKNAVDVHGLHCKSLPAQDVVVPSKPQLLGTMTQVGDSDAIVGFKEEARSLMEYLLHGENKLDVISVVGMPGVGKTTLASFLYNTPSVAHQFDILVWCVVSQSYQNRDLLLAILDQVNPDSISDDQGLTDQLYRNLKKRRYLIVLDDIWDTTLWNYLKRYLPDDREGSRILITTRYKNVAYQIGSKVEELHLLTEEKSWELFQKKMLNKESLSEDLLKISKGIVVHCNGLPLSIVIIAGILSDIERTEKMWNQIAESVSLLVLQKGENCKTILELSYKHLPNHLRSCFLYLGSFPEDYEISVNHLMHLWVGEGLVRDTRSESAEEVAKKYMDDLILSHTPKRDREGNHQARP